MYGHSVQYTCSDDVVGMKSVPLTPNEWPRSGSLSNEGFGITARPVVVAAAGGVAEGSMTHRCKRSKRSMSSLFFAPSSRRRGFLVLLMLQRKERHALLLRLRCWFWSLIVPCLD